MDIIIQASAKRGHDTSIGSKQMILGSNDSPLLDGIRPSRLTWLCQPSRIEHTLQLLYHLNYWIRTPSQLLYADRQGLNRIKRAIMQRCVAKGLLLPTTYIDGSQHFAHSYDIARATDSTGNAVINRIKQLFEHEQLSYDAEQRDPTVYALYTRITGHRLSDDTGHMISRQTVATFILHALTTLIEHALITRQPISIKNLHALCIQPGDLFDLQTYYQHTQRRWDRLHARDISKLDPEALSRIAFSYRSPTSSYCLHLPYRTAEAFLLRQQLLQLKSRPGTSTEHALYQEKPLTHPKALIPILEQLEVDIRSICPHNLVQKGDYAHYRPGYTPYWEPDDEDENL